MVKDKEDCFIIMPIGDVDGYPKGHFGHVYNNIIRPSCEMCGYKAIRGDEVKETNLIHLDILKKLIETPIAICDLSNRNPNVLFELGIRQAFDKPVVLIQEKGTPRIFDITPLRYLEYSNEMKYHDVLSMQQKLKDAIKATASATDDDTNVNSIVKLLALNNSAQIPDLKNGKESLALEVLQAEIKNMRQMMEHIIFKDKNQSTKHPSFYGNDSFFSSVEFHRILSELDILIAPNKIPKNEQIDQWKSLRNDVEKFVNEQAGGKNTLIRPLIERLNKAEEQVFLNSIE